MSFSPFKLKIIAVFALFALIFAGCSSSSESGNPKNDAEFEALLAKATPEDYNKAIVVYLTDSEGWGIVSKKDANCIAEGSLEVVGAKALKNNELLPEQLEEFPPFGMMDLSKKQLDGLETVFGDCEPDTESMTKNILKTIKSNPETSDKGYACFEKNITDEITRLSLLTGLVGDDSAFPRYNEVTEEMRKCAMIDMDEGSSLGDPDGEDTLQPGDTFTDEEMKAFQGQD